MKEDKGGEREGEGEGERERGGWGRAKPGRSGD